MKIHSDDDLISVATNHDRLLLLGADGNDCRNLPPHDQGSEGLMGEANQGS